MPSKGSKPTNNDFCPLCHQTYPRDQRDYHVLGHYQAMNKEVLTALENIRLELAKRDLGNMQTT